MKANVSLIVATLSLLSAACVPGDQMVGAARSPTVSCIEKLGAEARSFPTKIEAAQSRNVPVTIFAPVKGGTFPLIAFSHGAFAAPGRYREMLEPLAAAGFIVVAPMHIDSEEFPRARGEPDQPARERTRATRNEDFALSLDPSEELLADLAGKGLFVDNERLIALGHSYGALIAQLHGGAKAVEPDGSDIDRTDTRIDAVVGWSPPGSMAGFMEDEGWSSLAVPSLTLTGTTDVLPPFVTDWRAHKASFDNAPEGKRALWVGEGIDHYFGGVFGRVEPVSDTERALFDRAVATTLHFIETRTDIARPCRLGSAIAGELYQED